MPHVITRRRLDAGDFDAWMVRFAAGAEARRAAGCRGVRRFRSADDPQEIVVIFDWDTHENARRFVEEKMAANPQLSEPRGPGAGPKMEHFYGLELDPLPS